MLAEWREFEHLRRQPWNPSVAIILYRDGRTITEAKSELSDAQTTDYPVLLPGSRDEGGSTRRLLIPPRSASQRR
jgi:hypothetical protein